MVIDMATRMMTIVDPDLRSCGNCGKPFEPRSGSGGSVQRFCCADCRLSFHKERLRSQRRALYAGQSREPATQEPPTLFEQAERLIAELTLDERRRLIERLLADLLPENPDTQPTLLEPTEAATTSPGSATSSPSLRASRTARSHHDTRTG
jgi:recombinational DNA repair protein (RecF pathway)